MSPYAAALIALVALALLFAAVWAWQLKTKNAGMIDPIWAYSLGAVAVLYGALGTGVPLLRALVAAGGLAWGARLGAHLWKRNYGQPEDARYHKFRLQWGDAANSKMFWFFQAQVVISMLLSLAFIVPAFRADAPAPLWIVLAVIVWIASVAGEGIADRQLRDFRHDPANRDAVCRVGLWRYSRHPNYFFECLHWVAYVFLSIGTSWGWLTLLPPVMMAFLLMKMSGIPMVEESMAKKRPGYADYMRTTSPLIPWPPRHR